MGVIIVLQRFFTTCFLGFLFLHGFCASDPKVPHNSFVHDARSAPLTSYYDYIIIGGGTAGCPLAATLSQKASVLLLERGGSPFGNPNVSNSIGFGATLSDISPTSPSQRFVSEDGVINTRARILGGGSSINAGFYSRASAEYIRNMGWNEGLVKESYEWVEKAIAFEPEVGPWQSTVRDALLEVGVLPYNGFTYDHIYGTKVGGTIFDQKGNRHSAVNLLLHYANPSELTVLLHASVHQILFETKGKSRPTAYGVVYQDNLGILHKAYLKKESENEIIVSAGALGSPQLLLLSGVGPIDQLQIHNITVVMEQTMVGQHMMDNPMNGVFIPSSLPVEYSVIEVVGITHGFYIETASGTYFGATPSDLSMYSPLVDQRSTEPCVQRRAEAFRKAIKRKDEGDQEIDIVRAGFIFEKVANPKSTGYLQLRTRNPNDNPSVRFNYFKEAEDLQTCVDGISTITKLIDSNSFSKFRYDNISTAQLLSLTAYSNETVELEQYCKETMMTLWHYHGGCQVGSVVDFNYKVFGVDALRVIDGSTFTASPGTNPQATLMMLGRYMGVRILRERLESGRHEEL